MKLLDRVPCIDHLKIYMRSNMKQLYIWACAFILATTGLYAEYNVGLLVVATGKYIQFVPPLIESARKHFLKNHRVTYFIFTDQPFNEEGDVVVLDHQKKGWPYDTLLRCAGYDRHCSVFSDMDYLFACDADMLFVSDIGDEVLGDLVGTQHPGFFNKRGTYENRSISTAFVSSCEGKYYFAGGFYGGAKDVFLHLTSSMCRHIQQDVSRGIVAVWHDESHLNRCFVDTPPTVVLSPDYCFPGFHPNPSVYRPILHLKPKLVALDKNHNEYRS